MGYGPEIDQRNSRTMTDQFEGTAVKLSQGPLGIIALFIVLIHAFASLVLGLVTDIGENNRQTSRSIFLKADIRVNVAQVHVRASRVTFRRSS
jgi:hypothetical protein